MTDRPTGAEVPQGCPYTILDKLGEGGMAVVYRARLEVGGPEVALKLPRPIAPDGEARMRREIDVQSALNHESIMPILDRYSGQGEPWFTMPIAKGSLKNLHAHVSSDDIQEIMTTLAMGLEHAHHQNFIHRDISPGNILYIQGQGWVISDWGTVRRPLGETVTKLTSTGGGFGTLAFAAPEMQTDSPHDVGPEVDIYSLGRVAAWLITGVDPVPNMPLLPTGPWRGVIAQATESEPRRRCSTARAFVDLMEDLLGDLPINDSDRLEQALGEVDWTPKPDSPVWGLVAGVADDPDAMLDIVARTAETATRSWARSEPQLATELATKMSRHLIESDWGRRSFDYLNVPLGWIFDVLRGLAQVKELEYLEDAATAFFDASAFWDRFAQNDRTAAWLRALKTPAAGAVARALRRSGHAHYHATRVVDPSLVDSREIAAVLRATL